MAKKQERPWDEGKVKRGKGGKFAKKAERSAGIPATAEQMIEERVKGKLSPKAQEFLGKVHGAAEARIDTSNRVHRVLGGPVAERHDAVVAKEKAETSLFRLLGEMGKDRDGGDRGSSFESAVQKSSRGGLASGNKDRSLYLKEVVKAMSDIRQDLIAMNDDIDPMMTEEEVRDAAVEQLPDTYACKPFLKGVDPDPNNTPLAKVEEIAKKTLPDDQQKSLDEGLPEPFDTKAWANVDLVTRRGVDFPSDDSPVDPQKVGEALDEYYSKEAPPFMAKRAYPEEEREAIKARTVAMLSSAKSMDDLVAQSDEIDEKTKKFHESKQALKDATDETIKALRRLSDLVDDIEGDEVTRAQPIRESTPVIDHFQINGRVTVSDADDKMAAKARENLADVIELTGVPVPEGFTVNLNVPSNTSHWSEHKREMQIAEGAISGASGGRRTIFHEYGHATETYVPGLAAKEKEWLKNRSHDGATHDNIMGQVSSRDVNGYLDGYISTYTGRVYSDNHTELMSTGLEYFADEYGMAKLYSVDPGHFTFVLDQILEAKRARKHSKYRKQPTQRKDAEGLPLALGPQIMADFILGADPLTDIQGWTELEVLQEGGALASFLLAEYLPGAEGRWDTIVAPDVLRRVILSADPMVNISPWDETEVAGEAQAILTFLMEEYRRSSIEDLLKTPADYIPQDAAQYTEASTEPEATCKECFAYLDTRRCRIVRGHISPYGRCALWESATPRFVNRSDDNKPVQRVVDWQGLKLGLQYLPGDIRHGKRITAAYGHVRGTYGQADDGMAFDVWVNLKGGDRCFKLQQLTDDGEHDEFKYILGADSLEDAKAIYAANMPSRLMGEVVECDVDELAPVVKRKDAGLPWDEKKVVRGKGGKFAKKASAPRPMPVGTDKQRNAPDKEPGATFATKLSSGSNYCAVSVERAKEWAIDEAEDANYLSLVTDDVIILLQKEAAKSMDEMTQLLNSISVPIRANLYEALDEDEKERLREENPWDLDTVMSFFDDHYIEDFDGEDGEVIDELIEGEAEALAAMENYALDNDGETLTSAISLRYKDMAEVSRQGGEGKEQDLRFNARGYLSDAAMILEMLSDAPSSGIRATSSEDGEIIQVAGIRANKSGDAIFIGLLASGAGSMPATYKKQILKDIELLLDNPDDSTLPQETLKKLKEKLESSQSTGGRTPFRSADMLEGVISEKHLRGMESASIVCNPVERNIPLFTRAGFEKDLTASYVMTPENADKFWRMRQARSQRQDAGEYTQAWADKWDRDLANLEAELGPMMCGGAATRTDAGEPDHPVELELQLEAYLMKEVEPIVENRIARLAAAVNATQDYRDLNEMLPVLYDQLPKKELVDATYRAFMYSNLIGRMQVQQEVNKELGLAPAREDAPVPEFLQQGFKEAMDYLRQKTNMVSSTWKALTAEQHDMAYTVAGLMDARILQDVRWLIEHSEANGIGFDDFKPMFHRLITRKGWRPGEHPDAEKEDHRLKVLFETPIRRAISAGRNKQVAEALADPTVKSLMPGRMWLHTSTPERYTREYPNARLHHLALHRKVFPADHEFWKIAAPSCDYLCRCHSVLVTKRKMEAEGLTLEEPPDPRTIAGPGFQRSAGMADEGEARQAALSAMESLPSDIEAVVYKDFRRKGIL